jgi:hypothetical protein
MKSSEPSHLSTLAVIAIVLNVMAVTLSLVVFYFLFATFVTFGGRHAGPAATILVLVVVALLGVSAAAIFRQRWAFAVMIGEAAAGVLLLATWTNNLTSFLLFLDLPVAVSVVAAGCAIAELIRGRRRAAVAPLAPPEA